MTIYDRMIDTKSLDVAISELLVATADGCDAELDRQITVILELLRRELGMDVVFVSEFVDGQRVFRFVEAADDSAGLRTGDAGPLEESYCQRVVQGKLPELVHDASAVAAQLNLPKTAVAVGAHLSTPVVLADGRVYGTVCCFSRTPNPQLQSADLERLRQCAKLVAIKVDPGKRADFADTVPDWTLVPLEQSPWQR
jgi:GAF domain-containing protein